jgi:hypothetical protein
MINDIKPGTILFDNSLPEFARNKCVDQIDVRPETNSFLIKFTDGSFIGDFLTSDLTKYLKIVE